MRSLDGRLARSATATELRTSFAVTGVASGARGERLRGRVGGYGDGDLRDSQVRSGVEFGSISERRPPNRGE
jgi:hypothetical protein